MQENPTQPNQIYLKGDSPKEKVIEQLEFEFTSSDVANKHCYFDKHPSLCEQFSWYQSPDHGYWSRNV